MTDDPDFDRKFDAMAALAEQHGLDAVWSVEAVDEVADMQQPHPYVGATQLIHGNHGEIMVRITGDRRLDLRAPETGTCQVQAPRRAPGTPPAQHRGDANGILLDPAHRWRNKVRI